MIDFIIEDKYEQCASCIDCVNDGLCEVKLSHCEYYRLNCNAKVSHEKYPEVSWVLIFNVHVEVSGDYHIHNYHSNWSDQESLAHVEVVLIRVKKTQREDRCRDCHRDVCNVLWPYLVSNAVQNKFFVFWVVLSVVNAFSQLLLRLFCCKHAFLLKFVLLNNSILRDNNRKYKFKINLL